MNNTSYYLPPEERKKDKKTEYWESRASELLLSPFNQNKWSRI